MRKNKKSYESLKLLKSFKDNGVLFLSMIMQNPNACLVKDLIFFKRHKVRMCFEGVDSSINKNLFVEHKIALPDNEDSDRCNIIYNFLNIVQIYRNFV